MKKTTIIILICTAIILGMISGIVINILEDNRLEQAQINEIRKVNELEDKFADTNILNNEIVSTNSSDVKLSPNAIIYFNKHYSDCGHTVIEKQQINANEVNKTEEYFKDAYSDWQITKFDSNEVELYKEIEGNCDKHYLITVKDEHIAIYTVDSEGKTKLKEVTEVPIQYLPKEDVELLKRGINANGDNELAKKLEDFE